MIELAQVMSIMTLAFSLGLVHALDADHIMAVSSLSGRRPGLKESLGFCSRWALGHGAALLVISSVVLILGWVVPDSISHRAEQAVGFILVWLGLWVYWDIRCQHLHVHFHQHDGRPAHAHWHSHDLSRPESHLQHKHSATLVGLVHGVAGSAPLLALLPMSQLQSSWFALAYILVFGFGVFVSMLLFGGVLGRVFVLIAMKRHRLVNLLRGAIATASVLYGTYLLSGAFA